MLRCAGGQRVATGSELINIFEAHSSHSVFLYDTPSVQNGGKNRQKLIQSLSGRAFYNALQYIFLLLISQIQFNYFYERKSRQEECAMNMHSVHR